MPKRDYYTINDLMRDVMAIEATPSILEKIGTEIIYFEWTCSRDGLGEDNPITKDLARLLKFMEEDYEHKLLVGELWRAADTPRAAIKKFLNGLSKEVLEYKLWRDPLQIHKILESAYAERQKEIERCKQIVQGLRERIKETPDDPDLYNQLRLALWLLGQYKQASEAFQNAKKLGWNPDTSLLVAL